jgi:alkaline phosphatase D
MTVWDDHETADNSFEDGAGNHDPVNDGAWSERKAAGIQAYFEWMPLREQADNRIFRTITYGNLAELVFLDTRLWGRDEQVPANSTEVTNPDRTLLGTDQEQWLAEQLTTSSSKWKLVAQQVMMGQWRSPGSGGNLGPIFNADGWDGYDAARSRIFSSIRAAAVDNVVVLTGDIHSSWAMDLTESPYDAAMYDPATGEGSLAVEFVTPAVTSPGFPRGLGATLATNLKRANPHMRFVELESRGYLIVDLDADKARGSWFHHNDVIRETVTTNRAAVVTTYAGRNRLIVEA